MKTPTEPELSEMRLVLQERSEPVRSCGEAWMALAEYVRSRRERPAWAGWITLDEFRAPWLIRVLR